DEHSRVALLVDLSTRYQLQEWMLVPTDDSAVALVAQHHPRLEKHYKLTVPPWDGLEWACDKRRMHRLAERLGVEAPWTACPSNREELATLDCPFPVILKPAVR